MRSRRVWAASAVAALLVLSVVIRLLIVGGGRPDTVGVFRLTFALVLLIWGTYIRWRG